MVTHALCPECGKVLAYTSGVFPLHRRPSERWDGPQLVECPGSGWLVEDEDVVPGRWPRPS